MKKVEGFTLLQLVAAIVVMGIISAVAVVRFPTVSTYDVGSQKTSVLGDIRLTQSLALSFNTTYKIIFSSGSYQITDGSGNAYTFPGTSSSTITLPSDITLTSTTSTLQFNNLGQPSDATGTALSSAATVTLTASNNGGTRTITIQPQTGFSQ